MRDWRAFVRAHFGGRRAPSDQALEELAQHVEETWRAARAAGLSPADALAAARAELRNPPRRLPANMVAAALALTLRSSASSARCCSSRCRSRIPIVWS
jgi:hypothetical protein